MINFIFTAMAIASISLTIGKTYIFRPVRNNIGIAWLRKLLSCPYCLAHWLSAVAVIFIVPYNGILDFTIKTMALVTMSSLFSLFLWYYLQSLEE